MQKKIKTKIIKRFSSFKFKKIVLYKNPNEFCSLYIERVNPDHVGILWGKRKKKLNKGSNFIKCGRVYFSVIPVVYGLAVAGWLDMFTEYAYRLLLSIGLCGILVSCVLAYMVFFLPFKLGDSKPCLIS